MTESEWWAALDSLKVIDWLFFDTPAAERKLRLFSAACCRRVEWRIQLPTFLEALARVESVADGLVPEPEAAAFYQQAIAAYQDRWQGILDTTSEADACRTVIAALSDTGNPRSPFHRVPGWRESEDHFPYPYWTALEAAAAAGGEDLGAEPSEPPERFAQVRLLHDIFGPLPFREVTISPSWLTSDVRLLARGIYDQKAFDRMPILADALQDAGCDSDDILNHCRATDWEHVRGCWVIDLLLGRPWKDAA